MIVILYGNIEEGERIFSRVQGWKWFERWYPTKEAAKGYANKKGWDYVMEVERC